MKYVFPWIISSCSDQQQTGRQGMPFKKTLESLLASTAACNKYLTIFVETVDHMGIQLSGELLCQFHNITLVVLCTSAFTLVHGIYACNLWLCSRALCHSYRMSVSHQNLRRPFASLLFACLNFSHWFDWGFFFPTNICVYACNKYLL